MRGHRTAVAPIHLLADSTASCIALSLGHGLEAVAFAGRLAFAAVFCSLAIILAFAGRHAVAMHSGFFSGDNSPGHTGEQGSSREGNSSTSSSGFHSHVRIPQNLMGRRISFLRAGIQLEQRTAATLQRTAKITGSVFRLAAQTLGQC
jgi:hypothetical protein